jgi:hypothetical protein
MIIKGIPIRTLKFTTVFDLAFSLRLMIDCVLSAHGVKVFCDNEADRLGSYLEFHIKRRLRLAGNESVTDEERAEEIAKLQTFLINLQTETRL